VVTDGSLIHTHPSYYQHLIAGEQSAHITTTSKNAWPDRYGIAQLANATLKRQCAIEKLILIMKNCKGKIWKSPVG
jgi:hypothetical protein